MSGNDKPVEAMFLLTSTWVPSKKAAAAIEKKLKSVLSKLLFDHNADSRLGFTVKSTHETRTKK